MYIAVCVHFKVSSYSLGVITRDFQQKIKMLKLSGCYYITCMIGHTKDSYVS